VQDISKNNRISPNRPYFVFFRTHNALKQSFNLILFASNSETAITNAYFGEFVLATHLDMRIEVRWSYSSVPISSWKATFAA